MGGAIFHFHNQRKNRNSKLLRAFFAFTALCTDEAKHILCYWAWTSPVFIGNHMSLSMVYLTVQNDSKGELHSLKLTANAPETRPLEKEILIGKHPFFRGKLLSFRELSDCLW